MFFIERHEWPVRENDHYRYDTLLNSFLTTFSSFVGDPPPSKTWLDILFGIVSILVLLNVIIGKLRAQNASSWFSNTQPNKCISQVFCVTISKAIVSQEWDNATKEAKKAFWSYRLDFLQEITREFRLPGKVDEPRRVSQKMDMLPANHHFLLGDKNQVCKFISKNSSTHLQNWIHVWGPSCLK